MNDVLFLIEQVFYYRTNYIIFGTSYTRYLTVQLVYVSTLMNLIEFKLIYAETNK